MKLPPLRIFIPLLLLAFGFGLIVFNYKLFTRFGQDGVETRIAANDLARQQFVISLGFLGLACAGLWFGLNWSITRRANRIIADTRLMDTGQPPPPPLGGSDELAQISRAFRDAHLRLTEQDRVLRMREERYRNIIETIPSMVCVNRNGKLELINDYGVRLMRADSREDLLGTDPFLFIHPDSLPAVKERLRAMRATNQPVGTLEEKLIRCDGTLVDVEAVAAPFTDDQGSALLVIFNDITARKAAESRREALAVELAEKNRELETLIYVASHDLRSPLVNIQGFSRMIERDWKLIDSALSQSDLPGAAALREKVGVSTPKALGFISAGVMRLDGLLEGLLRMSRLGRQAIQPRDLDTTTLVNDILRSQHFQIQQLGATTRVDPLPRCHADPTMLNQALGNLLDNAIKYRSPDRPLDIHVSGRRQEDVVIYEVADNGLGIAPEHQQKIFEIFHRLNPSLGEGQGLGLTIAQRCVERMGGRIAVLSRPDDQPGCLFTITLPRARQDT